MSIIKTPKEKDYVAVSNALANDNRLSFEARGVLLYLLSKPNNWEIKFTDVEREGGIGREKRQKIFAELEKYGYFERIEKREAGRFGFDYQLHEKPINIKSQPRTAKPLTVKPATAQPATVNPPLKKKDITNTDLTKKERNSYNSAGEAAYREFYPQYQLTPYQTELLAAQVENAEVFRGTLHFWAARGYSERNIFDLLDRYRQDLAAAGAPPEEKPARTAQAAKKKVYTAEDYANYYRTHYAQTTGN